MSYEKFSTQVTIKERKKEIASTGETNKRGDEERADKINHCEGKHMKTYKKKKENPFTVVDRSFSFSFASLVIDSRAVKNLGEALNEREHTHKKGFKKCDDAFLTPKNFFFAVVVGCGERKVFKGLK
jgi:hypothetical protein